MCCFIDNLVNDGTWEAPSSLEGHNQSYFWGAGFYRLKSMLDKDWDTSQESLKIIYLPYLLKTRLWN
jgi:hypothetical protein